MNVGLIGCGRIAEGHMTVYQNIKNIRVIAASDINFEKAKALANKYKISHVFKNYTDLLEFKELDFVDICTPTSSHASISCDAAEYGHNILLEKPMALSSNECEKIIHAVKRHDVNLCVCHNQLFFPAMQKAKTMLDSGHYDMVSFRTSIRENPEMFNVPAWNVSPEEKGIIWEVGCHPAYLHLNFLKEIKEVYAIGKRIKYPVIDEFAVFLLSSGKTYGIIEVSWLSKETEKVYEINCSDGKRAFMIASPPYANQGYETLLEKTGIAESSFYSDIKKVLQHFKKTGNKLGYYIGHYYLINDYIESLKKGAPTPVPPEEGKKTIKLLECIEESLNTNRTILVN